MLIAAMDAGDTNNAFPTVDAPRAARAVAAVADWNTEMPVDPPPRLILAALAVVAPVPPLAIEIGVEMPAVAALTTLVPSQYKIAREFCGTAYPLPAAVLTVIENAPDVELSTQYCWTVGGTITSIFPDSVPVNL